ncbi:hypothetical protein E4P82_18055 [Candidatus Competibacter phosphatis]|uniref:Uncharacterized protein n=1 Tax=Candidatus Competibacter phosphatis TaxID=221280 RepID=A0ABX1TSL1_9GAMM|nr:hypothetical protein [Candidatus Competibacter phosphatis]
MARQSDGKLIIGGAFDIVDGVPRRNIARLNADGSLDATWNPGVNNVVNALAVDGSNNVYVGGQFTTLGGVGRNQHRPRDQRRDGRWLVSPRRREQLGVRPSGGRQQPRLCRRTVHHPRWAESRYVSRAGHVALGGRCR